MWEATSWVSPCPRAGRAGSWSLAAGPGISELLSGCWMVGGRNGGQFLTQLGLGSEVPPPLASGG